MTKLQSALTHLADTLHSHRYLWQPEPFFLLSAPWAESEPSMQQALLNLDQQTVNALLQDSLACQAWLEQQLPELFTELRRWQPTQLSPDIDSHHDPMSLGIGGRKWAQIQAFHQAMQSLPAVITSADWCGGKGYLAGYLAAHQGSCVDCLEIDPILCEEGAQRIDQFNLPVTFHQCDVLQDIPKELIARNERHVALHACGELHRRFWLQTIGHVEQACLSPCCFHLGANDHSQLSQTAKKSALQLNAKELRISLLETVTGGQSAIRQRRTEQIWRLAYDNWRRETTGDPNYQPLRSLSKRFFKGDPVDFFEWAAQQHGLQFDAQHDVTKWLEKGEHRFELSERIGIVRQGMKRYLEYFVVLDLACYAEEQGYEVEVVIFCDKSLTPRNLAVLAQRPFDPTKIMHWLEKDSRTQ